MASGSEPRPVAKRRAETRRKVMVKYLVLAAEAAKEGK
jgi:hypothetical protein